MRKRSIKLFFMVGIFLFLLISNANAISVLPTLYEGVLYAGDPYSQPVSADFEIGGYINAFGTQSGTLTGATWIGTYEGNDSIDALEALLGIDIIAASKVEVSGGVAAPTDTHDFELYVDFEVFKEDGDPVAGTWATFDGLSLNNPDSIKWDIDSDFVELFIVKGATYFSIFEGGPSTYGTWNTAYLPPTGPEKDPQPIQLSHLVAYKQTTTVPEPSTMFLLGFGLVGLGVIGRKKFKG